MTNISSIVETLLPEEYASQNENAVAFIEAYYEWYEQSDLIRSADILSYRDIDDTVDAFVEHFKKKYLENVPLSAISNIRTFIKNSSSFYEAKGTSKSIQLLLKLLYGVESNVYYPAEDIFTLSSGEWYQPVYLEVSPSNKNVSFVGKIINGTVSKATAIVESVARRGVNGTLFDVLYLSSVKGDFAYGERIVDNTGLLADSPTIIGSLNQIDVVDGGKDNIVGDILTVKSSSGELGLAQVQSIENGTGRINFEIEDSGFGYTDNAATIVSKQMFQLNTITGTGFERFETVVQPLANVSYISSNNTFALGSNVVGYTSGTLIQQATGVVVKTTSANSSSGSLTIQTLTGDFRFADRLRTYANTVVATISLATDATASANVVGYANSKIGVFDTKNTFIVGNTSQIVGLRSNTNAYITEEKTGVNASFDIGTLTNIETVYLNTDYLGGVTTGNTSFLDVGLDGRNSGVGSVTGVAIGKRYTLSNLSGAIGSNVSIWQTNANNDVVSSGFCSFANSTVAYVFETANTFSTTLALRSNTGFANIASPVTLGGTGYANGAALTFTGGGKTITSITITNGGTGYANGQHVTSSTGSNVAISIVTNGSGTIVSFNIIDGGKNFNTTPVLSVANTAGTGAVLSAVMTPTTAATGTITTNGSGVITSFTINSNSGYYNNPVVSVSGGTGANLYPVMTYGYGLSKMPIGNKTSTINALLSSGFENIGSIEFLSNINPGQNYNENPFIAVIEPSTVGLQKRDWTLNVNVVSGAFIPGELITQQNTLNYVELGFTTVTGNTAFDIGEVVTQGAATGIVFYKDSTKIRLANTTGTFIATSNSTTHAIGSISHSDVVVTAVVSNTTVNSVRGEVLAANSSVLNVKRLSLLNEFVVGSSIAGERSGATATILNTFEDGVRDITGNNALITGTVSTASGIVKSVEIIDSGFNYRQNEVVELINPKNEFQITGLSVLEKQGKGQGYWKDTNGFLDADKYLFDGRYYQPFSYEIQTSLSLDSYADIVKRLIHVSGTHLFGKTIITTDTVYTPDSETNVQVITELVAPAGYTFLSLPDGTYLTDSANSFFLGTSS